MQAVMERRECAGGGQRVAGQPDAAGRLRAWMLGTAFVACGAGMIPWLAFLAISLPSATTVPHWSLAWVGLDSMEAAGLFATGWLIRRGDPRRTLAAMATAVLLVTDAWFDITTSAPGGALTEAIVMAACAELPMAAICLVIAHRSLPRLPPQTTSLAPSRSIGAGNARLVRHRWRHRDPSGYCPGVVEIHGHRGARGLRPENTLPGLAHALAIGVDAIEFDVTLTGDDGLILAHNLEVEAQVIRDTAPARAGDPLFPYVGRQWRELTLAQTGTLDAGDRAPREPFQDTFVPVPGTGVPTFAQVCELLAQDQAAQVVLSIELKTRPDWADSDVRRLVRAVLGTAAEYGLTGRSRVLGFNWRVLREAAAADPAVPLVALVEPRTWVPGSAWLAGLDPAGYGPGGSGCAAAARDIGAAWVSPWDGLASAGLIDAAHDAGLGVVVWTVNDPARMAELVKLGADAIVTDRPDVLREVLSR